MRRLYSFFLPFPYVNELPQSLSAADSYLYADDGCIFYQHEDAKKIENVSDKEFSTLCYLVIGKQLSLHFGEDKTALFSRAKCLKEIHIYPFRAILLSNTVQ